MAETIVVPTDMWPIANFIFQGYVGKTIPVDNLDQLALNLFFLYCIIVVLSVLVYNLGFARKLPILKNVIIYVMLLIGCMPLTVMGMGLPVAEGMFVIAIIFGVYRFRLHRGRKNQSQQA
ncbi:YlaH-like protein [Aureibacillus halotolerans]|uniref:YlaH-like protein n=2 Tax=Aureibacillus halotolerans TaxID=1508390 RepID=A0A4R6UGL0_9BACI|nr:YlaH-like protein [Aureibacillus halotolerans]